ncbi:Alpha/Beta hydrolase protein [Lipomyces tetrasporus]|uniref:Alpha/Beta hydrolase protein n=1 Tax=Lipomyces tetrasporus TaxID=54092 RepID=A0AAD7QZF1_9ASCO|nr:Alpha/Beta hydrolase protein [Lipomyces tetrasporus]KAJ8104278.1 Alpha/Beta hydrolase protein [Lipomyces tetrasporus]
MGKSDSRLSADAVSSTTSARPSSESPASDLSDSPPPSSSKSPPPRRTFMSALARLELPLDFKTAMSQWWNAPSLDVTERTVLSFLPFFPTPDATRKAESKMIELSKGRSLNEFEVTRLTEPVDEELVVLHGYGAGLAFFYRNFDGLSQLPGWRLHALDLLGYGRSSRPKFKIRAKDKHEAVHASENWFIDSLEEWREKKGIEKFTLMAHSMGGYIGVAYALRHPERIKKLILVSPAGVPRDPWIVHEDEAHPPSSALGSEFTSTQADTTKHSTRAVDKRQTELKRPMPNWLVFLWERHVSPFSFVRYSGPLGPQLVSLWTSHRFSTLPTDEANALHQYVLGLFTSRGSGEYAITRLLAPGAYARIALLDRINELKIPTLWMYGENDWMDIKAGAKAARQMRANGVDSKCVVIEKAGHHLYLDNPHDFNDAVVEALRQPA